MLTKDIYHTIGLLLSPKDIVKLMLCSKKHNDFMNRPAFWSRKLNMDYPRIRILDNSRIKQLYTTIYNRKTIAYNWTEMLKSTDNISEYFFANLETELTKPSLGYCDTSVPTHVKERGRNVLIALKTQTFQLDRQRIEDQLKKIESVMPSFVHTRVDDHTLKTYKLDDEVTVWLDFNGKHSYLDCDRTVIQDSVQKFCLREGWPVSETNYRITNSICKNKIKFVSYFNDTYIIDMIGICNKDGCEGTGYDLYGELVVIHNYMTNYFLILGCDGHAFIESSDFSYCCSDGDGSNFKFAFDLEQILDMATVFYQQWTNYGGDDSDVDDDDE